MARKPRYAPGGLAYHVMNRTPGKLKLFDDAPDYEAFARVLAEAVERDEEMRVCAYCLMPNHWHLVLWPRHDGQLSKFMQWMTMTHTQRWHAYRQTGGRGHLYQSRFRSFVIQEDWHFLSVCRYVERNALRANLVQRAEKWPYGSMWSRQHGAAVMHDLLAAWPVSRPRNWTEEVNEPQDAAELAAIRKARDRGRPYGQDQWSMKIARRLHIESSLNPIGRPKIEIRK